MLLIQNAETFAPERLGRQDILLAGGRIEQVAKNLDVPPSLSDTLDATGLIAVPGFVDGHVHLIGGGGEGGFATRTPELMISDAIRGGVTSLVGCLGTDGITRSLTALLAKARALEEEGLSTWMYSGAYGVPLVTLTGSLESDLILIDKVLGAGEVAISDHRSSQPTFESLARLAGEARRGGMLAGKAGLLHLHLGDGMRRLELLERLVTDTELPVTQFLPTHINRNPHLFEKGLAWAQMGGAVDFTTSTVPRFLQEGEIKCSVALRRMLNAGVDPSRITFSSDGQGSLPDYHPDGTLKGLAVGRVTSLFAEVRDAIQQEGIEMETALSVITLNPARTLKLKGKGRIASGADADLVLLRRDLEVDTVIARGRLLMHQGKLLVRGTFEAE